MGLIGILRFGWLLRLWVCRKRGRIGRNFMKASLRAGKFDIPLLYEDNHLLVVVKPAEFARAGGPFRRRRPFAHSQGLYWAKICQARQRLPWPCASPRPSCGRRDGLCAHLQGRRTAFAGVFRTCAGSPLSCRTAGAFGSRTLVGRLAFKGRGTAWCAWFLRTRQARSAPC